MPLSWPNWGIEDMLQPSSFLLHPTLTDRGTYGGDVIGLQVKDDFLHSLDAFFHSEVHLVVFTADVSCNLTNTSQRTINEQQADVLKLLNLLKGGTYDSLPSQELTLRAAIMSGLSSDPIENVWIGYCNFSSLASFTSVAATKLESRPPEDHEHKPN